MTTTLMLPSALFPLLFPLRRNEFKLKHERELMLVQYDLGAAGLLICRIFDYESTSHCLVPQLSTTVNSAYSDPSQLVESNRSRSPTSFYARSP